MYYASIGMLSLVIHVIINFSALTKRKRKDMKIEKRRYRHFLYGVLLFFISDIKENN